MVVLVSGERQAKSLDRIGDEADRPIVFARRLESVEQARQVVAAEIAHEARKFVVRAPREQRGHAALIARLVIAKLVSEALAPCRPAREGQRRIELVRAVFDPAPQGLAARLAKGVPLQARHAAAPRHPSRNCGTSSRTSPKALHARRRRGSGGCNRRPTMYCAGRSSSLRASASKILPSSISASPMREIILPSGRCVPSPLLRR